MDHEKRERTVIYVTPETARRWNEGVAISGSRSKSDFAGRAIDFYTGYLSAQEHTGFLADIFAKVMTAIVHGSENRLARLHFKTAVEMAKLSHTVASQNDIDDETLRQLHIRCVEEVKRINGVVRFEDAVRYQHDK